MFITNIFVDICLYVPTNSIRNHHMFIGTFDSIFYLIILKSVCFRAQYRSFFHVSCQNLPISINSIFTVSPFVHCFPKLSSSGLFVSEFPQMSKISPPERFLLRRTDCLFCLPVPFSKPRNFTVLRAAIQSPQKLRLEIVWQHPAQARMPSCE